MSPSFGYHAGGWGKPPVDELGKPLYGDVFGTADSATFHAAATGPEQPLPPLLHLLLLLLFLFIFLTFSTPEEVDQTLWGEMDSESEEESSEEEEEEDEEEGAEGDATGLATPVVETGLATPSGTTSSVQVGGHLDPTMINDH